MQTKCLTKKQRKQETDSRKRSKEPAGWGMEFLPHSPARTGNRKRIEKKAELYL